MLANYSGHRPGKPVEPMVSVEYAIVPGINTDDELPLGYDIDATVSLDPPADAQIWGDPLTMGGERSGVPDPKETTGAFGPFVLPQQTRRIVMQLRPTWVTSPHRDPGPQPAKLTRGGRLTIDLQTQSASFTVDPA